jgi:hypothetical protein
MPGDAGIPRLHGVDGKPCGVCRDDGSESGENRAGQPSRSIVQGMARWAAI